MHTNNPTSHQRVTSFTTPRGNSVTVFKEKSFKRRNGLLAGTTSSTFALVNGETRVDLDAAFEAFSKTREAGF